MTVHNFYQKKIMAFVFNTKQMLPYILLTLSQFLQNKSYWRTMKYLFTNNVAFFLSKEEKSNPDVQKYLKEMEVPKVLQNNEIIAY